MKKGIAVTGETRDGGVITGRFFGNKDNRPELSLVVGADGQNYECITDTLVEMTPSELQDLHNEEDEARQVHGFVYADVFDGISLTEIDYPIFGSTEQ